MCFAETPGCRAATCAAFAPPRVARGAASAARSGFWSYFYCGTAAAATAANRANPAAAVTSAYCFSARPRVT